MELSILDSSFRRSRLVENWNSLIWTERYSKNGDFQMVSNNINEVLALLPLGPDDTPTVVAVDNSDVPMVVETHKIEKPKNESPRIITSGRSFETVLDRRVTLNSVVSGTPRVEWQVDADTAAIAVFEVAKSIIVDGDATALDIIPEILLINGVTDTGTEEPFVVEPKELYAWMIDTLALGKYGLCSSMNPLTEQIAITIYKGTDRREEIVFDVSMEQIDRATYLLSNLGYKNVMIVAGKEGMEFSSAVVSPPGGLARRVDFLDLSSEIELPEGVELTDALINRGKVALSDRLPIALFAGGVSENISDGYNSSYFLGDLVSLRGEYGLSQEARVSEFVRTEDSSGYKAYPTFESIFDSIDE